ncbi:hypothetical protein SAMN05892877_104201 [Rhizobium subbaraonis]|uniref:Uncharacterized protein n=1 Tax=Rhizobium subbaraonis TaxID=908946 RepID=A0A285U6Q6_9HYPH|nr:hypothetical protein SAMN05892877_104201 [Rhizobium subbaraonis]
MPDNPHGLGGLSVRETGQVILTGLPHATFPKFDCISDASLAWQRPECVPRRPSEKAHLALENSL